MTLRILVVDDELDIRRLLKDILGDEGHHVDLAGNGTEARALRAQGGYDLTLLDIWMPDVDGITLLREWTEQPHNASPVVMMSGHATIEAAVQATRLGAVDFIEKPVSLSKLLQVVQQMQERARVQRSAKAQTVWPVTLVGRSRVMRQLREQSLRVAASDAAVLLTGEPGAGREWVARFIHQHSERSAQPLVMISPASIADDSAAQELFGSESTAVSQTGAVSQAGLLEQAQGGTVFIKGLEDASAHVQRLLLAALETRSVTRVGGVTPTPLNVRWLASTQSSLSEHSTPSGVRVDLFMRLGALTLAIPALRERTEDVPELLRHCAEQIADADSLPLRRFGLSAQNRLRNYPWPGNVQELRNLVRRLLILGGPEEIRLDELEKELHAHTGVNEPLVKQDLLALPLREAREHFERAYLQQQLSLCDGKVGQLAKRVGMERTHLYRKLRMLGVDFRQLAED